MKRAIKIILIVLLIVLVCIQFIRPAKNISNTVSNYDITNRYSMPPDVLKIFQNSCYDCHSNNTRYPWYSNVQPVDWWLTNHINEGKRGLNFDEYTNRRLRYQYGKMDDVIDLLKKGEMPLNSYTWIHKDAILTDAEKTTLINWAQGIMDTLKAKYPADSLLRKKQ